MTDEERQKLCEVLRLVPNDSIEAVAYMRMAANEIERLAHIVREARKLLGPNFEREMANDGPRTPEALRKVKAR